MLSTVQQIAKYHCVFIIGTKRKLSGALCFIRAEVELFIIHEPYDRLSLSLFITRLSGILASHRSVVALNSQIFLCNDC